MTRHVAVVHAILRSAVRFEGHTTQGLSAGVFSSWSQVRVFFV